MDLPSPKRGLATLQRLLEAIGGLHLGFLVCGEDVRTMLRQKAFPFWRMAAGWLTRHLAILMTWSGRTWWGTSPP